MPFDVRDRNHDGVVSPIEQADIDADGKISILDIAAVAQFYLQKVPDPAAPIPNVGLVEQLIFERGAHQVNHDIVLPKPHPDDYSWGRHAQEAGLSGTGSLNLWIVANPDNSQVGRALNAYLAVKRCRLAWLVGTTWHYWEGAPGLGWMVECNYTSADGYNDVFPNKTLSGDGAWAFKLPQTKGLHLSQNSPGVLVPVKATAVCSVVEARVIGPDAGLAKWGFNAGADWKDANGKCDGAICAPAGLGRFNLASTAYKTATMLASALSDANIRSNPPVFA